MSAKNGAGRDVGLVLGGGGARGAYASGALSVLLPELKDQVSVIVGQNRLSCSFGGESSVWEGDGDAGAAEVDHRDQRVG